MCGSVAGKLHRRKDQARRRNPVARIAGITPIARKVRPRAPLRNHLYRTVAIAQIASAMNATPRRNGEGVKESRRREIHVRPDQPSLVAARRCRKRRFPGVPVRFPLVATFFSLCFLPSRWPRFPVINYNNLLHNRDCCRKIAVVLLLFGLRSLRGLQQRRGVLQLRAEQSTSQSESLIFVKEHRFIYKMYQFVVRYFKHRSLHSFFLVVLDYILFIYLSIYFIPITCIHECV